MNAFLSSLSALTAAVLKLSLQASLVIGLVLLVQWAGGKRLSPRVRYALWLLVVLRLLLPVSLETNFSLFNFTRAAPVKVFQAGAAAANVPAPAVGTNRAPAPISPAKSASAPTVASSAAVAAAAGQMAGETPARRSTSPAAATSHAMTASSRIFHWGTVLSLLWLGGVIFLLARILWIPLRLNARLAQHEVATPSAVFDILEESKRRSGVQQVLPIVQSRAVESPALLGFIRPWLLLPAGLVEKFTPQELRLVFLHELAHLQRRDIAVNWLATLLQILHWPNPLVWLAFARMRADRELACDELALSYAPAGEGPAYGRAIIKLIEGFEPPAALPGLVGILEDQTQMQRRIAMIAQFRKMTKWSAAPAAVVLVLGLVTLTDGQTENPAANPIGPAPTALARTLYSGNGNEAALGVLSPDESTIAWSRHGRLELIDVRTRESRLLTNAAQPPGEERAFGPIWSPDSKFIVYAQMATPDAALHRGSWKYTMRVIPRAGGEPRILVDWTTFNVQDWSPTGKLIAGIWGTDLVTVDATTGERRAIGPTGTHPRFSRDGRFVVYERTVDGNRDIYLVSVGDGHLTRITDSPAEDGTPVFSADGRWILFSSNRRGTWDLWAIPFVNGAGGGSPVPLKYDFGDHCKWITASGKLAYRISSSGVDGIAYQDVYEVVVANAASVAPSEPRPIAKSSFGRNRMVSWSPDGKMIAYHRSRGAASERGLLCVLSVAEGVERTVDPGLLRNFRHSVVAGQPDHCVVRKHRVARGKPGLRHPSVFECRSQTEGRPDPGRIHGWLSPELYPRR